MHTPSPENHNENELSLKSVSALEFLELSPQAILLLNQNGKILHMNNAAHRLLKSASGEPNNIEGKWIDSLFRIIENKALPDFLQEIVRQCRINSAQLMQLRGSTLEDRWVMANFMVPDEELQSKIIFCYITLSPEVKPLAEENLHQGHLLVELINSLPDNIYIKDKQSRFLLANQRISEVMGTRHPSELIGKSDFDFYPKKLAGKYSKDEQDIIQSGKAKLKIIEQVIDSNGNRRWYSTSKIPLRDNNGVVLGIMGIGRDITDSVKEKKALRKALHDTEKANLLKTAFLANISHEIRTPLNGILGFSQFLQQSDVSEDKKEKYLEIIVSNGKQLLRIINDLIDISKIDSGQIQTTNRIFHLNELMFQLKEYLKEQQKLLNKQNIEISMELSLPDEEGMVYSDDVRLRQLMEILLGNGVKFTVEGSIQFGYNIDGDWINFYVRDTGIGIAAENQQVIFERFRQGDHSLTRKYGGNGLGLSIAKGLSELLHGSLSVTSELGEGSKFILKIPYKKTESNNESLTTGQSEFQPKKIVLLADNDTFYELIDVMLLPLQVDLMHAHSESELIAALELKDHKTALLIFHLETKWIVCSGLIDRIKAIQADLPIVLICNSFTDPLKEKCMKAGATNYLIEPIVQESLLEMISKCGVPMKK